MKFRIVYFLIVILFTSCVPSLEHASLPPDCQEAGSIQTSEVENTSRGYPYSFAIYLPPCYDADANLGYPIIFMIPGLGSGISSWFNAGVNEIADQLILAGEVPPFILVTTESTSNASYAEDIYGDLIPYIEANFNVLDDRDYRAIAGGSLGGSATYRLTFRYPNSFASAGMFGSGVVNGENEQVASWLAATNNKNRPRVFINVGEQDPLMLEQALAMTDILDNAAVPYKLVVSEGDHSYVYWASNMDEYFRWVAQDW